MKLISYFIYRQKGHRQNLAKIINNVGWLFFDKVLRMGVGLLVGVWIARYLGPEQFGILNFATAFAGLFGAIASLGLQEIVVRDIIRSPDSAEETLGTAAVLQLIGGLIAYLLVLVIIAYLRPDDALVRGIVAILGSIMLLKASEVAVYWFESRLESKYTVWVQNAFFIVFSLIKVVLILQHAPLIAFVFAILSEAILAAAILLIVMGNCGQSLSNMRWNIERAKTLLIDSWPLVLSGMAVSIYMKIDQIMLDQMLGHEAVGVYSAATSISEVWYFIPMAIVASVFPTISEARKRSEEEYYAHLQKLYDLMVVISVAIALPMTFLSEPLVHFLYGKEYQGAGTILAIHIWSSVFVFLGVASSKWILLENRQVLSLQRTALGAVANIMLNLWIIPIYGAVGAALATVVSYGIAAFFADLLYKETRKMFSMKVSALNPIEIIRRNKW